MIVPGKTRKRRQDEELELNKAWLLVVFAFVFTLPFYSNSYIMHIANVMGMGIIVAQGLNILMGYTGQISLGHAAFVAVGAYTSAILTHKTGLSFWFALPISGIMAACVGMIVAIPSLRLKELYLAIATMGYAFIINEVIVYWKDLTNGTMGMMAPTISFFNMELNTGHKYYYLVCSLVVLLTYFSHNLSQSKLGRALMAVRDSEEAAQSLSISLVRYKIIAFTISAFYAGIAGSLYSHFIMFVSPENFGIMLSIEYLVMLVVGGMGHLWGAVLGAIFVTLLPEVIRLSVRFLPGWLDIADLQLFLYGLIIIIFLIFEPEGLYARWLKVKRYVKTFPLSPKKQKGERVWRRWR
ncbi:MAG: branched-chain amino acid ABC transporter permease [Pseudomonadota bacterium]